MFQQLILLIGIYTYLWRIANPQLYYAGSWRSPRTRNPQLYYTGITNPREPKRDINVRSYITRGAGDPREQVMLKIVVFNDQMLNKYDKTMNINLFLRFL